MLALPGATRREDAGALTEFDGSRKPGGGGALSECKGWGDRDVRYMRWSEKKKGGEASNRR